MRLSEFLASFFFDDEIIYGRALAAKGYKTYPVPFTFTRNQLADTEFQKELIELNKTRGIYFVVNAGGNSDAEITRINAVFCEIDTLPLQVQHDIYDNSPLPPSIRIETKKSVHAYWLLSEFITANDFRTLQKGLINYFNSDKGIHNPARLMRLPFFKHVSFDKSFQYQTVNLHSFSDTRFTYAELFGVYPHHEQKRLITEKKWKKTEVKFDDAIAELIHRVEQTKNFKRHGAFGYTNGICHGGKESPTALYINYNTGFVGCFGGCGIREISNAFNVELKNGA